MTMQIIGSMGILVPSNERIVAQHERPVLPVQLMVHLHPFDTGSPRIKRLLSRKIVVIAHILLYDEDREKKDVASFLKQTYICDVESECICPDETQFKVGVVFNSSFYSSVLGNDMCRDLGVDIAFMVMVMCFI